MSCVHPALQLDLDALIKIYSMTYGLYMSLTCACFFVRLLSLFFVLPNFYGSVGLSALSVAVGRHTTTCVKSLKVLQPQLRSNSVNKEKCYCACNTRILPETRLLSSYYPRLLLYLSLLVPDKNIFVTTVSTAVQIK